MFNDASLLKLKFILIITVFGICGCGSMPAYDYSALMASSPRSILVIPPENNSVEVNASYTFISTITEPLAEKGYYVFPVAVIDHFLKENGLPTPAEMNSVPLDKLRQHIGPDAVLYVTINNWGQKYQVIQSKAVVSAQMKLIDARDGSLLWQARAYAEQNSSDSNNNGLAGALIGALVDQIAGSIVDNTFRLSRRANNSAINHSGTGLLDGPYRIQRKLETGRQ